MFPVLHQETFFNEPWVQAELGIPLNFTITNPLFPNAFFGVGDPMRVDMSFLAHALQSNVSVAMVFGDRDYRCNCMFWRGFLGDRPPDPRFSLRSLLTLARVFCRGHFAFRAF